MTNEVKLKDAFDELENKLNDLVDDNEKGIIDDTQFSTSVAVLQMHKKLLPYHEELQNLEETLIAHIGLVFNLILKKQLTPKEEQEIKRKIKEIKDIFNNFTGSKKDKEQQISEIAKKSNDLLLEIVGLL
jgi:seryl-tRNA synthetase